MIEYLTEQEVLNMDTNYIIETKKSDKAIRLTKECGGLKYPCQAWENLWSVG